MDDRLNNPASVPVGGEVPGPMRARLISALRIVPAIASMTIWIVLIGACGRSIFPFASNATPTPTITTSPTTGNFLYSSDFGDGKVARFTRNLTTGNLTFNGLTDAGAGSSTAGSVGGPSGLATGPNAQFLYVTNSNDADVNQFKIGTGGNLTVVASAIAAGKLSQWIAVTPNAQFAFVTNFSDGTISQYTVDTTTGELTANGTFTSVLLKTPYAAVASNAFLYVTDSTNGTVVSFTIGTTGTLSGGNATSLSSIVATSPGPVITDPTGSFVYATDTVSGMVYFLTVGANGVLSLQQSISSSFSPAAGLVLAITSLGGEFLFVANPTIPSISIFTVDPSGMLSFSSPVLGAPLSAPFGLVVDPTGTWLYAANQGNGTITQFTITTSTGVPQLVNPVVANTGSTSSQPIFLAIGQ